MSHYSHHLRDASLIADHPSAQAARLLRNGVRSQPMRRVQSAGAIRQEQGGLPTRAPRPQSPDKKAHTQHALAINPGLTVRSLTASAKLRDGKKLELLAEQQAASMQDQAAAQFQQFRQIGAQLRAASQSTSELVRASEKDKEAWTVPSMLFPQSSKSFKVFVSGSTQHSVFLDEILGAFQHRKIEVNTHKCEKLPALSGDNHNSEDFDRLITSRIFVAVMDNAWIESASGRHDLLTALLRFHHTTDMHPQKGNEAWLGKPFLIAVDMRKDGNSWEALDGENLDRYNHRKQREIHDIDFLMEPFLIIPGKVKPEKFRLLAEEVACLTWMALEIFKKRKATNYFFSKEEFVTKERRRLADDCKILRDVWKEHDDRLQVQRRYIRFTYNQHVHHMGNTMLPEEFHQHGKDEHRHAKIMVPGEVHDHGKDEHRHTKLELLRSLNCQTRRFFISYFNTNLWEQQKQLATDTSHQILAEARERSVVEAAELRVEIKLLREQAHSESFFDTHTAEGTASRRRLFSASRRLSIERFSTT